VTPAERLARLSADEMVAALKLARAPAPIQAVVRAGFTAVSSPLGRTLARFDALIATDGLARAAASALDDLGARWSPVGAPPPSSGPLLVVANHPGAYDALVLFASTGRDDVAVLASDRALLRAMPNLRRHLLLVPESVNGPARARARGLRGAIEHLAAGGSILHFGAGAIEPDLAFPVPREVPLLSTWQAGAGSLVRATRRASGWVVTALVEGVHSPRAKRLLVNRLAERQGVTTLAPLLQVAFARYRDVAATVRFTDAVRASDLVRGPERGLAKDAEDARIAAVVRERALASWPSYRLREDPAERLDRVVPAR
jgi:hypothetical protein